MEVAATTSTAPADTGATEQHSSSSTGVPAQGSSSATDDIVNEAIGTETKAPKAGETTSTQKPKFKLKAKNREIEVDDEQLRHYAQKAFGAESTYEEGKKAKEEAAQIRAQLDALKDPKTRKSALKQLMGDDFRAVAEETLYEDMVREQQESQLSEREKQFYRQLQQQQATLDEFKGKEEKQNQARQEARERAVYQGISQQIETTAMEAMNSLKLPPNLRPQMANRMVKYIEAAVDQGVALEPQAIATFAVNDMKEEYGFITSSMDGEALVNWLGADVANRIRKYDLQQYEARRNGKTNSFPQPAASKPASPSQPKDDPRKGRWNYINEILK